MYVYIESQSGLHTVGFYDPSGAWHAESDHPNADAAAVRCAFLNGQATAVPAAPTALLTTPQIRTLVAALIWTSRWGGTPARAVEQADFFLAQAGLP